MEIRFLSYREFAPIRDQQLQLFRQLKPLEILAEDEYGDLIFENGKPVVIGENKPGKISYPGFGGMDDRVPQEVINSYEDVFGIDEMIKRKNPSIKTEILALFKNNVYQGSTWIFYNNEYMGMIGIRTSVENYLLKVKGIASIILREVIIDADGRPVVVPDPLEGMIHLLEKNNFVEEQDPRVCSFFESIYHCTPYFILRKKNTSPKHG